MFVTASPAKKHARLSARLLRKLSDHVEQHALGEVFHTPADVRLTPYDVVVPDLFFLSAERGHLFGEKLVDGPPDLVVEILSQSTRLRDLNTKLRLYARAGVAEYWIVDPEQKSVAVHFLNAKGGYDAVPQTDHQIISRVLPEFDLSIDELFSGLD